MNETVDDYRELLARHEWQPVSALVLDGGVIEVYRPAQAKSGWSHGFGIMIATPREWNAHGAGVTHFRRPVPPVIPPDNQ